MANKYVQFDLQPIYDDLLINAKQQAKYAAEQALKQFSYTFAKRQLPEDFKRFFDRPVPRTTNSGGYEAKGLESRIYIKDLDDKGQSPAKYLYPVSSDDGSGKPALDTRFVKGLRRLGFDSRRITGGTYAIPNLNSPYLETNKYGNVKPSIYANALQGLKTPSGKRAGYRYVSVPPGTRSNLAPGLYRVKGRGNLENLFNYTTTQPKVPTLFNLAAMVQQDLDENYGNYFSKALRRATGGSYRPA